MRYGRGSMCLSPCQGTLRYRRRSWNSRRAPRAPSISGLRLRSLARFGRLSKYSARDFGGKPGWVRDTQEHPPEMQALMLSSALAQRILGWRPQLSLEACLSWSADWYRAHLDGEDMLALCQKQIAQYQSLVLANRNRPT